ncbi:MULTISPECIES: 30S ribosomal protein S6 [unclassified Treponema]|uniref:30S ribosomal protein S6 n=1 Tax=unclassified Treponema TaxID=2638727 RepID=UPI001AFCD1BE|nr:MULTISPECIES: 30S ribosomal protein S6 [unclassified Treponema]MBO6218755.1 30S ribosomal protein S6 [Treponema sp.]MBQ8679042.1 30S ribosomal protein S6 [Treponema sp.]
MKKYELMTIYPIEDEKFKDGTEKVKAVLAQFGATIEKEESYGERDLAYEIKKIKRGKFVLFTVKANPAKIVEINTQFRLNNNLLKSLFVKLNDKEA